MASELELSVQGTGTRKQLADALRSLANNLFSDDMEEIYNINGAYYNDNTIEVTLKDVTDENN